MKTLKIAFVSAIILLLAGCKVADMPSADEIATVAETCHEHQTVRVVANRGGVLIRCDNIRGIRVTSSNRSE